MEHSKNISKLIGLVDEAAPTTEKEYPSLKDLTELNAFIFKLGHSARHLTMSAGKINEVIHDAEHGAPLDTERIKSKLFSTMFTVCKISKLLGINGDQLVEGTEALVKRYKEENEQRELETNDS